MTGKSKRFKEAGISLAKQFLPINGKTMIEHTLDMFPNEQDINFIVSNDDYQNKDLEKHRKYLNRNIEVRYITSKKYNLRNILEDLSSIGICNLLVEGGAKIFC